MSFGLRRMAGEGQWSVSLLKGCPAQHSEHMHDMVINFLSHGGTRRLFTPGVEKITNNLAGEN